MSPLPYPDGTQKGRQVSRNGLPVRHYIAANKTS